MIGDGVIAESVISFKLTWKNPGNGEQPKWDQNSQEITFHESNVYPDLLYTKAQAIATYYKYTSIDSITSLIKDINSMIESKLGGNNVSEKEFPTGYADTKLIEPSTNTSLQTIPKPQVSQSVQQNISNAPVNRNEEDIIEEPKDVSGEPSDIGAYTVVVYGKSLKYIDAQLSSSSIRIRHKVSENLNRTIGDVHLDNSNNIWLEVRFASGKVTKLSFDDFNTEDKSNLLVQIFPTIDLILVQDEKTMVPKSEKDVDREDNRRAHYSALAKIRNAGPAEKPNLNTTFKSANTRPNKT